jgi:endoglucanase Acf2
VRAGALLLAAGCAAATPAPAAVDPTTLVAVGAARYTTAPLADAPPPSSFSGQPVQPKVTTSFDGVPTTNDWWSSLIWQYDRDGKSNPFSEPLFALPLVLQAHAGGLGLSGPGLAKVSGREFFYPYREDLLIGIEGLVAPAARVASYGDWVVTARWEQGGRALEATFGHGLPFAYCQARGGAAVVGLPEGAQVRISDTASAVVVTAGGQAYGLFGPRGATWVRDGRRLVNQLRGGQYFSVAALPDDRPETLARFRKHAFAFVTGAQVSWRYDAAAAELRTTFTLETTSREAGQSTALVALSPHQWKHLGRELGPAAYQSPRGPLKLLAGNTFETRLPWHGVLPVLPRPSGGSFDGGALSGHLRAAARASELFPPGMDGTRGTYWTGKSLQRVALQAWLADQAGERETRERLVAALKSKLEDWFDGAAPNLFRYDRTWATLVGAPSEYRSGWEMNDHHFHYGQFIFAAATVARFDPAWAAPDRWGGFVDLLVKDCANPDRGDRRFPFLRHFDPWAGHSWANGPALFAEGNNEESSSEDANFATATILWGALTGRSELRDLGIFLHANLTAAIDEYWFDVDGQNFPRGFDRPALGMVWGGGGKYDTWWDRNPIYVHGINFLPFSGGSLYLGRHPDYVKRNHAALVAANHGPPRLWRDIIWMYLALAEPKQALALLAESPHFEPEFGSSRAFVYQWLHALDSYGQVDTTVRADLPTHAVLRAGGKRHHVAFNPTATPAVAHFSDGVQVPLGPFEEKVVSTAAP